jgi:hypothetical protein
VNNHARIGLACPLPKISRSHRNGETYMCECGGLFRAVSYEVYDGSLSNNRTMWKWVEV